MITPGRSHLLSEVGLVYMLAGNYIVVYVEHVLHATTVVYVYNIKPNHVNRTKNPNLANITLVLGDGSGGRRYAGGVQPLTGGYS